MKEKILHRSIRSILIILIVMMILTANQNYNQKITSQNTGLILDRIDGLSSSVICVPVQISIDEYEGTIITQLGCERGDNMISTGSVTGELMPYIVPLIEKK